MVVAQRVFNYRELIGKRPLHKLKATVTFSDDEILLDLQIPSRNLVSYPLSEKYLLAETSVSNQDTVELSLRLITIPEQQPTLQDRSNTKLL